MALAEFGSMSIYDLTHGRFIAFLPDLLVFNQIYVELLKMCLHYIMQGLTMVYYNGSGLRGLEIFYMEFTISKPLLDLLQENRKILAFLHLELALLQMEPEICWI